MTPPTKRSTTAATGSEGLYRLVDAAYEKRSVATSSNLHPSGFDELMPKTLATATVDRLLHHAHVCQTSGDSVGLTQALASQGVSPLSWAPGRWWPPAQVQILWPPPGTSRDRQRAGFTSATGQFLLALDTALSRE